MLPKKTQQWIDERTGYKNFLHAIFLLNFPTKRRSRWQFIWGGALVLMMLVEMVTGALLMTVYSPSEASAWGSVHYIETQVDLGWFVRGLHHYTAHMMIVAIVVHIFLVIISAGYRKPKEFIYWTSLLIGGVIIGLTITGNPLPWDQKGYWSYQIETGIAGTMPVIGSTLRSLVVGGSEFGNLTLTRLYTIHVIVLPLIAMLLFTFHMALIRRERLRTAKIKEAADDPAVDFQLDEDDPVKDEITQPYWPYQTTRTLVLALVLIGIVIIQLIVYPALKNQHVTVGHDDWVADLQASEIKLEAPADSSIPYVARPEWFVRFLFELRHMVPKEMEVLVTAVLPGVILAVLFLVPFYEKVLGEKWGQRVAIIVYVGGLLIISGISWYGIKMERSAPDYALNRSQEIAYAARASWLASQNGVPPEGPASLLRNDPKSMGPLIFARHCGICHTWNGHDGTGHNIMEMKDGKKVIATPRASDLAGFATTKWLTEFLMDPKSPKFFGHLGSTKGGDAILNGDMSDWADSYVGPEGILTKADIEAVAALVAREANHRDFKPLSEETVKRGVSVFSGIDFKDKSGKVAEFYGYCAQCHAMKAGDPEEEGGGAAPDFNGYGSEKWLTDFIRKPGAERFYGEKNIMPSFEESKLSKHDLNLLVKWMRGEWQRPETEK
ncbi:cytochrome b N-terminal domain-containing protein [Gimesia maris]|uniref:Cytochrome b6 n=3 Tax=Gimesia maris TaxID=122 RepID=A0ABX5YLE6_9PLAN|nr:cytochrome b N-terminal domain-containing protein [Gimesia maris]EDL57571.1 cytochrome b6 [Gimesia maris DSM 8797]MAC52958.1 hypothetical protein [Gimesia sp.]QDT79026.1 Cytochrome b6 [Gimesia maris]QEG16541.1 Cytochrome b6 [Gimesia maris]